MCLRCDKCLTVIAEEEVLNIWKTNKKRLKTCLLRRFDYDDVGKNETKKYSRNQSKINVITSDL